MNLPADRPSLVAIARALCALPILNPEPGIYERECLEEARKHLNEDPPNFQAAKQEFADGVAQAFRVRYKEERPEAWLIAACAELLRDAK